jgi:imidazolonepropionase-like amidohydrolase
MRRVEMIQRRGEKSGAGARLSVAVAAWGLAAVVTAGFPDTAEAQTPVPAPPQDRPVALVGGTIHPVTGPAIPGGTLVFEDGVITAMGTGVEVPAGAVTVELEGRHVYPGLIDAHTAMGLFEIGGFTQTIDLNELGTVNPNVRAQVAFNPETRHTSPARSQGVLIANSSPAGGLIAGQAAAMMMDGWTWEEMTLAAPTAMIVNWPVPGSEGEYEDEYEERVAELRSVMEEARRYAKAQAAEGTVGSHPTDSRWEAMLPVLAGEVPVMVNANEVRQIQDAVTWAEEEGVRLVILGGRDAGFVADHLARKEVPVLLSSVQGVPGRGWQPFDETHSLPARLYEAGVPFGIAGGSSAVYAYRLAWEAGTAVAFGLPEEEALRAVTLHPARFLGIDHRVGSLEVGKDATLLVTTGSPLEYSSQIDQAYIQGRAVDMNDVHRLFYEKYRQKSLQRGAAEAGEDGVEAGENGGDTGLPEDAAGPGPGTGVGR